MSQKVWLIVTVVLLLSGGVESLAFALAQVPVYTTVTQSSATESPTPWNPTVMFGLGRLLQSHGWELHGLFAANYTFNFNEPRFGKNQLFFVNNKHNHFALDIGHIRLQRDRDTGIGFLTDIDFGRTAEAIGHYTRWCKNVRCRESRNSFELHQFYLTYTIPIGAGLTVKAGKWASEHGAEVIKTWNNFNPQISHSLLFTWAIPDTHVGLSLQLPLAHWLSVNAGMVVGWDNLYDNNDGKSFTCGFNLTPTSTLSVYAASTIGPEQDDRGDATRGLFTLLTIYEPTDKWTFMLDYNVAYEESILSPFAASGRGTRNATWDGLAGYVIYKFTSTLSGALRAEFFNDSDGIRTDTKQTVWEFTTTLTYQLYPGFTLRIEFRHDESSQRVFMGRRSSHYSDADNSSHPRFFSGQDIFAWEALYAF
jgi:hypothetical protein